MIRRATAAALMSSALLVGGALLGAPTAVAAESYEECMATTAGTQTWGCYNLTVKPTTEPSAAVDLFWNLNTSAEGFSNADWKGGVVLTRWPVKGQWKKYPPLEAVQIPGPHEKCNDDRINDANCYRTFSGPSGTTTIEFGPKMAGYVYEMYSHDYICSTDKDSCGPSGGSIDKYVFVLKAYQYTNKAGQTYRSPTCPPKSKRSSKCTPATIIKLADSIGGGEPVPLPD